MLKETEEGKNTCDFPETDRAQVRDATPIHMWTSLMGFSRLVRKIKGGLKR